MKASIHRNVSIGALGATAIAMPYSVQLCHWSFLLFVLCWMVEGNWKSKWMQLRETPLAFMLPAFFLLHLIGMLYTTNTTSGWFHIEKKAAFLLIPLTLASTTLIVRKELGLLVRVFIISCAIACVYCIGHASWVALNNLPPNNFSEGTMAEFERLNPGASGVWMAFSYVSLASGIQIHPTYFGLYLIVCLLFMLFFFKPQEVGPKEKVAGKMLFIFFLVFIFFLSSRITTLCAVAVAMSALILRLPRSSWSRTLKFEAAVVLAVILIVYANPVSRYRGFQEPAIASLLNLPDYTDTSIEIRLSLLKLSSLAGTNGSVLFGSGTGTAEDRLGATAAQHGISNVLGSYDPHNQFIYTYMDLGVLGLMFLIAVIIISLRAAWNRKSITFVAFTLVFSAVCLTESALELQKGIVLFTFFGSLLVFHEMTPEASHHRHV